METNLRKTLSNLDKNNSYHILQLHPKHRNVFVTFIKMCQDSGEPVWIFSSQRTFPEQRNLYLKHKANPGTPVAAAPGFSLHNYGLAIDIYVYNPQTETFYKNRPKYQKIARIAKSLGLRWLGERMGGEEHHFDYKRYNIDNLYNLYKNRLYDNQGFLLLDRVGENLDAPVKVETNSYQTELGQDVITTQDEDLVLAMDVVKTYTVKNEKMKANGIWQIVKLVADQYSLSQTINDASIAHNQGSLYNFIQNVIQEPWLQFFGDTIDNKYCFFARKEPFDYNGFAKLPINQVIKIQQVLDEQLDWYDGAVFSWYQIIPRGSFLGEQNLIFAYVTAVFFEEYADIWGSKPNIQVSNYINFAKAAGKATLFEKALEDLRYMVESNAYLPFTRQGTITIKGKSDVKRGYRIHYTPTNEMFYVSAVSQRCTWTETGPDYTTVLRVERGMRTEYTIAPENASTKSYFNIINFENRPARIVKSKIDVPAESGKLNLYFDNSRSYPVDMTEVFPDAGEDAKMVKQIAKFPSLRTDLSDSNKRTISIISEMIEKNYRAKVFKCVGHIDSDDILGSKRLPKKRAETFKKMIIDDYVSKYKKFSKSDLESLIIVETDVAGMTYNTNKIDDGNVIIGEQNVEDPLKIKAYQRYAGFSMEAYSYEDDVKQDNDEIGWKVNREVFQFFLNRKQNG